MPFVSRSSDGAIDSIFEQRQDGRAEEFLDNQDSAVVAFLNAPVKVSSVSARQFRLMLRRSGLLD
ncbi:hypothetical protein RLPCCGM1_c0855 [Rhizobium leguminosarum bv. phaseoli CCGM1]|uniref:hypothetical protein n=1 Tax=Rhizobium phaseoli TaxID=396 RepID=UPI0004DABC7A|nr:hypothetical protein RLPCCGM1_c0855 [Rhizobium leguminosarum bv. phaseoli CCGM1]